MRDALILLVIAAAVMLLVWNLSSEVRQHRQSMREHREFMDRVNGRHPAYKGRHRKGDDDAA